MLCDCRMHVNARIDFATFRLRDAVVHGSFVTEVHLTYRTNTTDAYVGINASQMDAWNSALHLATGVCDARNFVVRRYATYTCADVQVRTRYSTVVITTPLWNVSVTARPVYDAIAGPEHRLDFEVRPDPHRMDRVHTASSDTRTTWDACSSAPRTRTPPLEIYDECDGGRGHRRYRVGLRGRRSSGCTLRFHPCARRGRRGATEDTASPFFKERAANKRHSDSMHTILEWIGSLCFFLHSEILSTRGGDKKQ